MKDHVDFRVVSEAACRSVESIVDRYLPGGRWEGDEYVVLNPTRNDSRPGSFKINRRGMWSDFATGDKGDMIDLVAYVARRSKLEAAREMADLLGIKSKGSTAHQGKTSGKKTSARGAASPQEAATAPKEFPRWTTPDAERKPRFIEAGDQGPRLQSFEKRRHVYRRGGVPVRIKIMRTDEKVASNAYRVTSDKGKTGWQFKKPEGFQHVPYFKDQTRPFKPTGGVQ
jgi:putative DNA primase/helicase